MSRDWQSWFLSATVLAFVGFLAWLAITNDLASTVANEQIPAPIIPEPTAPSFPYVWHDIINGATCYLWQGSIDCIPDWQLERR